MSKTTKNGNMKVLDGGHAACEADAGGGRGSVAAACDVVVGEMTQAAAERVAAAETPAAVVLNELEAALIHAMLDANTLMERERREALEAANKVREKQNARATAALQLVLRSYVSDPKAVDLDKIHISNANGSITLTDITIKPAAPAAK